MTGSQASISTQLAEEFNITIIPYYLLKDGNSQREGVDFDTNDFYETLKDINSLPTSSPPSIGDIVSVIDHLSRDHDELVLFTLSAKYSQMYNSCKLALSQLKSNSLKVHLVDSKGATAYQAMLVIMAARMVKNGWDSSDIITYAQKFNERADEFIILNTLKYLAKGGRIGKVKAFMGSLLSIKPVIVHRNGEGFPITRVRTNQQALTFIKQQISQRIKVNKDGKLNILLQGIGVDDWLKKMESELSKDFNISNLWFTRISAVTSIHYGPESWSLTYCIE